LVPRRSQSWFVTIDGRRHNLGPDEKEAKRKFHELMALPDQPRVPASAELTVAEVFEKFLEWCQKHRAPATYDWFQNRIQKFTNFLKDPAGMPASQLKPFNVVEWVDTWGGNFRRGCIGAIQRPFNWAVRLGYLPHNPILRIDKPQATRREQIITPDDWIPIRDHYADQDPFRDLLEFAWETGCRPQEVKCTEARHVQLPKHRVVFPKAESKNKKKERIIYMTPRAEAIIERLMKANPEGLLFLNSQGRKWTCFAMACRFTRLKAHLGVKYACYSLRHGFATRKLEAGVDHLTVAAWLGHSDGSMLAKIYSHIGERSGHLQEQLNKEAS
jgi:integrase